MLVTLAIVSTALVPVALYAAYREIAMLRRQIVASDKQISNLMTERDCLDRALLKMERDVAFERANEVLR